MQKGGGTPSNKQASRPSKPVREHSLLGESLAGDGTVSSSSPDLQNRCARAEAESQAGSHGGWTILLITGFSLEQETEVGV